MKGRVSLPYIGGLIIHRACRGLPDLCGDGPQDKMKLGWPAMVTAWVAIHELRMGRSLLSASPPTLHNMSKITNENLVNM
jgi:hypothetical protein